MLIDFRLGGMDGLQLQECLRAMGSPLSVILISAYADVAMAVRAMKNGAVTVIEKPYKNDDLADAVRKAMDLSTTPELAVLTFTKSSSTPRRAASQEGPGNP